MIRHIGSRIGDITSPRLSPQGVISRVRLAAVFSPLGVRLGGLHCLAIKRAILRRRAEAEGRQEPSVRPTSRDQAKTGNEKQIRTRILSDGRLLLRLRSGIRAVWGP
jgi:hypothetical protein